MSQGKVLALLLSGGPMGPSHAGPRWQAAAVASMRSLVEPGGLFPRRLPPKALGTPPLLGWESHCVPVAVFCGQCGPCWNSEAASEARWVMVLLQGSACCRLHSAQSGVTGCSPEAVCVCVCVQHGCAHLSAREGEGPDT